MLLGQVLEGENICYEWRSLHGSNRIGLLCCMSWVNCIELKQMHLPAYLYAEGRTCRSSWTLIGSEPPMTRDYPTLPIPPVTAGK